MLTRKLVSSTEMLTVMSFLARGSLMAASSATWVAAPELYPTNLRATGHSLANTMARLGAFASPYFVDSEISIFTVALIFAIMNLCSCCAVLILPETAGISLDGSDDVEDDLYSEDYLDDSVVVTEAFNPITSTSRKKSINGSFEESKDGNDGSDDEDDTHSLNDGTGSDSTGGGVLHDISLVDEPPSPFV